MTQQPVAWGLLNPATGKINTTKCYVHEETATRAAANSSNRWRAFVAVPLFLHPSTEDSHG